MDGITFDPSTGTVIAALAFAVAYGVAAVALLNRKWRSGR